MPSARLSYLLERTPSAVLIDNSTRSGPTEPARAVAIVLGVPQSVVSRGVAFFEAISPAIPISTLTYMTELQRDWAREATAPAVLKVFEQHRGSFGSAMRWEWDLVGLKEGTR